MNEVEFSAGKTGASLEKAENSVASFSFQQKQLNKRNRLQANTSRCENSNLRPVRHQTEKALLSSHWMTGLPFAPMLASSDGL